MSSQNGFSTNSEQGAPVFVSLACGVFEVNFPCTQLPLACLYALECIL